MADANGGLGALPMLRWWSNLHRGGPQVNLDQQAAVAHGNYAMGMHANLLGGINQAASDRMDSNQLYGDREADRQSEYERNSQNNEYALRMKQMEMADHERERQSRQNLLSGLLGTRTLRY